MNKEDSAGFAKERFGEVLLITTLGRAGDDDDPRERRLIAVLRHALPLGCGHLIYP